MKRFVPGFILNRMQAALIREAVDLVASGVADVEAIDTTIRDGLGLRWAFMGPFAVANTNADGGVQEYFTRYRQAYHDMWDDLRTGVRFDDALVAELHRQTEAVMGSDREAQRAWRDRLIAAIRAVKAELPLRGGEGTRGKGTGKDERKGKGRRGGRREARKGKKTKGAKGRDR
jgi:hypothetical protein